MPQHREGTRALDRSRLDQLVRDGAEEVHEKEDRERHEQARVEHDHRLEVVDPARSTMNTNMGTSSVTGGTTISATLVERKIR